MVDSQLDDIPGLGPVKKKALLAHFGSLKKISQATQEQLQEVAGIGPSQATEIRQFLAQDNSSESAVNTATGEIIES